MSHKTKKPNSPNELNQIRPHPHPQRCPRPISADKTFRYPASFLNLFFETFKDEEYKMYRDLVKKGSRYFIQKFLSKKRAKAALKVWRAFKKIINNLDRYLVPANSFWRQEVLC